MILNPFRAGGSTDRNTVLEEVRKNCTGLAFASAELKDDKEVVLEAVKFRGLALQYASRRLKNDLDVAVVAVKESGSARRFISRRLRDNRDVIIAGLEGRDWSFLEDVPLLYRNLDPNDETSDETLKKVVRWCVMECGENLKYYCCRSYKGDREIVLKAVKQDGKNLMYADEKLRSEKDIVIAALQFGNFEHTLNLAGEEMKNDREVVTEAVSMSRFALKYASDKLKSDKEIVLVSVKNDGLSLEYASKEMKDDEDIVTAAMESNDESVFYASERLKNDTTLLLPFLKRNFLILQYCGGELQNDPHAVLTALDHPRHLVVLSDRKLNHEDRSRLVLIALPFFTDSDLDTFFKYRFNLVLMNDWNFLLSALDRNWKVIRKYPINSYSNIEQFVPLIRCGKEIAENVMERKFFYKNCNIKHYLIEFAKVSDRALEFADSNLSRDESFVRDIIKINRRSIEHSKNREFTHNDDFLLPILRNIEVLLPVASKDRRARIRFVEEHMIMGEVDPMITPFQIRFTGKVALKLTKSLMSIC